MKKVDWLDISLVVKWVVWLVVWLVESLVASLVDSWGRMKVARLVE